MDWLELPARALGWVDLQMSAMLGPAMRLTLWSVVGGALTMLLYGALSPQRRIAAAKRELAVARDRLDRFDGEMHEALPLMRRMLGSAFRQLGLVVVPALVALLPMILLASWLAQSYGHVFPQAQQPVAVRAEPAPLQAQWRPAQPRRDGQTELPRVSLRDDAGRPLGEVEMQAPVPVLAKRTWRTAMIVGPLGFLPDGQPVDRVEIDLPRREFIAWGPQWMRGWEFLFFGVLTVVALGLKRALRLQ
ncbi:hypothetical protein [Sinimarinibacterium flocculans]|uniref:hypothetical protein n=1 Tax=Sinimarinibacterium flocculans TaxID=985250 RepID=UPI0024914305|nr:hypothetical protein [Sinimarinibacterium flocculans]